ncbi:Conserved_hypothetical protein [Hexamita inflata]|uniref:Uncharacterized protein n=1 Tax=Hexamita inflata TaxID=28002 RepID=A0AA86NPV9_9EUKA|nr:Conserved hypothetical protein [Hexamita inflata]CAI9923492.1 Conserved hypothetical protein [Hexamita inflata]
MLSYLISVQLHVTSMAEFNYCYNFIYEDPMGAGQIITGAVTFDDPLPRTLCNKTTNSIFRTTHTPVVQFRIDAEVDLASSNFSLFFMTMTDLVIQDSRVELKLKNGQHNDVRGILSCNTDFDLELFAVSVKIQYDALSAFYGLTFKMKTKLVLNQTKLEVAGTQTDTFFGLAHQLAACHIENSSFAFQATSLKGWALVEVQTEALSIKNISLSGALSGNEVYGLVYEAQAAVSIDAILFSLVMNGAANACAFVFKVTGAGSVSQSGISFSGISNDPLAPSALAVGLTCPCPPGAWLTKGVCHCTADSAFDSVSQTCKCTSGLPLTAGLCNCPANSALVGAACVCQPANTVLDNGVCKCTVTGQEIVAGACQCTTSGAFVSGGACACGVDSLNSSNACSCPTGAMLVSGTCTCSNTDAYVSGSSCVCPTHATLFGSVCTCPSNSVIVNYVCTCNVISGQSMQSGSCQCTNANAYVSGSACVCPTYAPLVSTTCTCPANSVIVSNTCKCNSDAFILSISGNTLVCQVCPANSAPDAGQTTCDCTGNSFYSSSNNTCTACGPNSTVSSNVCVCDSNSYQTNNVSGSLTCFTCPVGSNSNNNTKTCDCTWKQFLHCFQLFLYSLPCEFECDKQYLHLQRDYRLNIKFWRVLVHNCQLNRIREQLCVPFRNNEHFKHLSLQHGQCVHQRKFMRVSLRSQQQLECVRVSCPQNCDYKQCVFMPDYKFVCLRENQYMCVPNWSYEHIKHVLVYFWRRFRGKQVQVHSNVHFGQRYSVAILILWPD